MEAKILHGLTEVGDELRHCALTIGNFDGVHLGHRKILQQCRACAQEAPVVAMTFHPSPQAVLRGGLDIPRIDPLEPKCRRLLEAGADAVIIVRTDMTLLGMTPDEFVQNLIVRKLEPQCVVEGPNFRYGVARAGNIATLQASGRDHGFEVQQVGQVEIQLEGETHRVSSTLIRGLLGVGKVEQAAHCLDRLFTLYGPVVKGQGKGRDLHTPTANIEPVGQVLPQDGVYAGWAQVADHRHPAAISVGIRPTMEVQSHAIEAHILDFDQDLYGQSIAVELAQRLRDQEAFASLEELQHQMAKDIESVRRICR
jgi:riboflavin kinase/FMN adenylyltransferase